MSLHLYLPCVVRDVCIDRLGLCLVLSGSYVGGANCCIIVSIAKIQHDQVRL